MTLATLQIRLGGLRNGGGRLTVLAHGFAAFLVCWVTILVGCERRAPQAHEEGPGRVSGGAGQQNRLRFDNVAGEGNPVGEFPVFDAMHFRGKPDLAAMGFRKIAMVYARTLWPAGVEDRSQPDEKQIATKISSLPAGVLVCLDIEHWGFDEAHFDETVAKLVRVMRTAKRARPDLTMGLYGLVPDRDYWSAVADPGSQKHQRWRERNRRLKILAHHVDVLFPSLYTFYPDRGSWELFARRTIQEARQYGKPVYPFLWPQYHQLDKKRDNPWIDGRYWALQLDVCRQVADGVVLWGPEWAGWDGSASWWKSTRGFMDQEIDP